MEAAGHRQDQAKRRRTNARDRMMRRLRMISDPLVNEVHEEKREEDYNIGWFRREWENSYANCYGSFEDITVPPMRYTFGSKPKYAGPDNGVQIFSVKISKLKEEEGLCWPLHIYGLIAIRDSIDHRRNLLFHHTRDDCQILTQEDPFLLLTGPSRAVVLIDPIAFEVQLKAKGKTESEDKVLNFDVNYSGHATCYLGAPHIVTLPFTCKRSEVECAFALLAKSVEATIRVEVVDGSWPHHFGGLVVTRTASIDHANIVLLNSRDRRMPINHSGVIELSRRVVSVELSGELKVDVVASQFDGNNVVAKGQVVFTPKEAAISHGTCDLGFCKLGSTVAWSVLSPVQLYP